MSSFVSRLTAQRLLGCFWLTDGLLQLKPAMFSQAFLTQVILPAARGQPAFIAHPIIWAAALVSPDPALWNGLFAFIQILIGVCLLGNWAVRPILWLSMFWTAVVWLYGEGAGQLLTGQATAISGAPGAVLLYGLAGIAVWPPKDEPRVWRRRAADFARHALAAIWMLGAALQFQQIFLTARGLSQSIAMPLVASWVTHAGPSASIALGLLQGFVGLALLVPRMRVAGIWSSFALAAVFWAAGQEFGQILQPLSTDVNSGPLLMLLALCAGGRGFASVPSIRRWPEI